MGAGRARPQLPAAAMASALLRPGPPKAVGAYAPATPLLQIAPPLGWLVSSSVCTKGGELRPGTAAKKVDCGSGFLGPRHESLA